MFWRVATFSQASPIDAILDKEAFTLEELLDEDDIIQECKAVNVRLVSFLKNPSTIASLIRFLSEPPEDDTHFRYSFTACEIFCCELDDVFGTLLEDDTLMASLFSLLDRPPPLNSTLAGYFGRVVGSLLIKRSEKTHEYLQRHRELLPKLVAHIDSTSTVEVILRMIGADEVTTSMTPPGMSDWLAQTDLMQLLLARLCSEPPAGRHARLLQEAAQRNVAHIMVMLAGVAPNPLADQLIQRDFLRTMLEHASRPNSPVLRPILSVFIALLEPARVQPAATSGMSWGLMQGGVQGMALEGQLEVLPADQASVRAAAAEISTYLDRFEALLAAPDTAAVQQQPFGTLRPPLGRRRLTVVEFGKALLSTNLTIAVEAVIAGKFVPHVMQLFRDFPFNNILHSYVVQILVSLLETLMPPMTPDGASSDHPIPPEHPPHAFAMSRSVATSAEVMPSEDVSTFLFEHCELLDWIVDSDTVVPPASAHFQAATDKRPLTAAYGGHLTELSNQLLRVAKHNDSVQATLDLNRKWGQFVENVINLRNEVQDPDKWDVGRPPVDTTRHSSDADEDERSTLRPHFPAAVDETDVASSEAPICPVLRYQDEDDNNSLDSDNSTEDDAVGPPSHHIADESDSDSSDGGDNEVYPRDLEEPQTIEDEDEVELGDEATLPDGDGYEDDRLGGSPDNDGGQSRDDAGEAESTDAAALSEAFAAWGRPRLDAAEPPARLGREGETPAELPAEDKEFIATSFWKLPLQDVLEDELP